MAVAAGPASAAPGTGPASTPYRVAVVVAGVVNLEAAEARALSAQLARTLSARLEVSAIDGSPTTEGDELVAASCVADAGCLGSLLARLRVDELFVLNIAKVGRRLRIEVARFRAGDERAVSLAPIESEGEPAAAMAAAAPRLLPSVQLRRKDSSRTTASRAPVLALAATSALALAVAGGFGLATWSEHRSLGERCRQQICSDESFDSLRSRRLTADIALGVGVLAGAAALLWHLRGGGDERADLAAGPGDFGASWVREF